MAHGALSLLSDGNILLLRGKTRRRRERKRDREREKNSLSHFLSPPPAHNGGLWAARKDKREHLLSPLRARVLLPITTPPSLFYRDTERLSNLLRITQLVSGRARALTPSISRVPSCVHALCLSVCRLQAWSWGQGGQGEGTYTAPDPLSPKAGLGAAEAEPGPATDRGQNQGRHLPPSTHQLEAM